MSIENTTTVNQNLVLTYPYAANDTNNKVNIVLGPASMTPCNVLRIEASSIVPLQLTTTQINNLTLIPTGVNINMIIETQYTTP